MTTTLTVPAPAQLHGRQLTEQLHAAGYTDASVVLVGDQLDVFGLPQDVDQAAVRAVVDAHQPVDEPPPAPAVDDLTAVVERLVAVEGELRGMRERAAAASVTGGAALVRDAITGGKPS